MQPSRDERMLAALAHASIITNGLSLVGLIAAAAIWATQRERSAYVRRHAIQALAYQGAVVVLLLITTLSWAMCIALSLLPVALRPELYGEGSLPGPFWLALSGLVIPLGLALAAGIYGLAGALQAYRGRPFTYPLVGRLAQAEPPAPQPAAPELPATPAAAPAPEEEPAQPQ